MVGQQDKIRSPRVVKATDRFENMSQNNVALSEQNCARIKDDELRRRWMELRRAYLAFEKFISESY